LKAHATSHDTGDDGSTQAEFRQAGKATTQLRTLSGKVRRRRNCDDAWKVKLQCRYIAECAKSEREGGHMMMI
jgi:hypothetical protein